MIYQQTITFICLSQWQWLLSGGNISELGPYYQGHYQIGTGLGNLFRGLLRYLQPLLLSGSKAIGSEIVRSANEMVGELGKKPLKELLKQHSTRGMQNLVTKAERKINSSLEGRGIKRARSVEDNFSQIVKRLKSTSTSKALPKNKLSTASNKKGIVPPKKKKKKSAKEIFLEKYSLKNFE